jgi:hypothetical protein
MNTTPHPPLASSPFVGVCGSAVVRKGHTLQTSLPGSATSKVTGPAVTRTAGKFFTTEGDAVTTACGERPPARHDGRFPFPATGTPGRVPPWASLGGEITECPDHRQRGFDSRPVALRGISRLYQPSGSAAVNRTSDRNGRGMVTAVVQFIGLQALEAPQQLQYPDKRKPKPKTRMLAACPASFFAVGWNRHCFA